MPNEKKGPVRAAAAGAASAKKARTGGKATRKSAATPSAPKTPAAKKAAKKTTAPKAALPRAAARKTAGRKAATKKAAVKKAAPAKAAAGRGTGAKSGPAGRTSARTRGARGAGRSVSRGEAGAVPAAIAGLGEEDQIRAAKFIPRETSDGLFEEERFHFPESYGVDRVRLLVRDPEWIFAYWDVSSDSMKRLVQSLGERAYALSRLTLRVVDPTSGGQSDILLPPGARWWYIRSDATRRTYRAEIGVTLPTGEFRSLAASNTVVTPRVGPSREPASRRLSYGDAGAVGASDAAAAGRADRQAGVAGQPWTGGRTEATAREERGGASDVLRPRGGEKADRGGASDVFRPGASDAYRR